MSSIGNEQIFAFLKALGESYQDPVELILIGGSALCLLGSPRTTLDIDYLGPDLEKNSFQERIEQIAQSMGFEVEPVQLEKFIPINPKNSDRNIYIGRFGIIDVFILDPYSIALSKIDRGFDTDIDDVVFLLQKEFVNWGELEALVTSTFPYAKEFDLEPAAMKAHLEAVRARMSDSSTRKPLP